MLNSVERKLFNEWIAMWLIWHPEMKDDEGNLQASEDAFRRMAGG